MGIVINRETEKPIIKISSPNNSDLLDGEFQISFDSYDITGIQKIEMYLNDSLINNYISPETRNFTWNSYPLNGIVSIKLKAYDNFGNASESNTVRINIKNRKYIKTFNDANTGLYFKELNSIEAYNGKVWIGAEHGLFEYDGISWKDIDQHQFSKVYALCVDKEGALFIGSSSGLFKYKNGILYNLDGHPEIIAVDSLNIKWLGTSYGLYRYNDIAQERVYGNGYSDLPYDCDVISLKCLSDNSLVVGTDGDGTFIYEQDKWKKLNNNYSGLAIEEDRNGDLWMSGSGIKRYRKINGYYKEVEIQGLEENHFYNPTDIKFDMENNCWLISRMTFNNPGRTHIIRYDGKFWTVYEEEQISGLKKMKIIDDNLWIVGYDGVTVFGYE